MPRAPTSDRLEDTHVGDETPVPLPAAPREIGGTVEIVGHRGPAGARTTLRATPAADGLELRVTVAGAREAEGGRLLGRDEAGRLFAGLAEAMEIDAGGSLAREAAGSVAIDLAFGLRTIRARLDGATAHRLAHVADLLLQEVALCGVSLSPELHPLSLADLAADRAPARPAEDPADDHVDDDDETLVR